MAHQLPTNLLSNCTDGFMYCLAQWAYVVTGGVYWTFMLLGFCVAVFLATLRLGGTRAYGYASFVGMIGSVWLAVAQLMPWWATTAFIIAGLIGLVGMKMSEN